LSTANAEQSAGAPISGQNLDFATPSPRSRIGEIPVLVTKPSFTGVVLMPMRVSALRMALFDSGSLGL
jgi:hypothetical protein